MIFIVKSLNWILLLWTPQQQKKLKLSANLEEFLLCASERAHLAFVVQCARQLQKQSAAYYIFSQHFKPEISLLLKASDHSGLSGKPISSWHTANTGNTVLAWLPYHIQTDTANTHDNSSRKEVQSIYRYYICPKPLCHFWDFTAIFLLFLKPAGEGWGLSHYLVKNTQMA